MIRSIGFRAMNTTILLAAEGDAAPEGIHATKLFVDTCEQRFSRFLPASELSELNRSAGSWIRVSDDMLEMLQLSLRFHRETNGIFDPSILPDLKRIGYDRSMDEIRTADVPNTVHPSQFAPRPEFTEIRFDQTDSRFYMPAGMEIDLGGLAKGWIIGQAAHLLHTYAKICAVSAGGDMLFIGHPSDGFDWDVCLEDPRDPGQMLAQFRIPSGAVATSSIRKRSWSQDTNLRHHLIDPHTGESAETDWLSVTVISPDILTAEVYAKAILISGKDGVSTLLKARPDITWVAVNPDGSLIGSPNHQEYLYELTTEPI